MQCPIDGSDLLITHREGIEIDYCPKCRGVWLDRGELDKLIERSAEREVYPTPKTTAPRYDNDPDYKRKNDDDYYDSDDRYPDDRRKHGKRRGSFLGDIFDIFD